LTQIQNARTVLSFLHQRSTAYFTVIDAIRGGKIDTDKIKTHSTTLADAVNDLPLWAADRNTVIKAIIKVAP
jgi:threonine dehydrogenase-like Zn-dependent dehydrogenase